MMVPCTTRACACHGERVLCRGISKWIYPLVYFYHRTVASSGTRYESARSNTGKNIRHLWWGTHAPRNQYFQAKKKGARVKFPPGDGMFCVKLCLPRHRSCTRYAKEKNLSTRVTRNRDEILGLSWFTEALLKTNKIKMHHLMVILMFLPGNNDLLFVFIHWISVLEFSSL